MMAALGNGTVKQRHIKDLMPHDSNIVIDALVIYKSALRLLTGGPSSSSSSQFPHNVSDGGGFISNNNNKNNQATTTTTTTASNNSSASGPVAGTGRSVFTCTLRDSISDFVNLSVWGDGDDLFNSFHIGDIVRIAGARVVAKKFTGDDEKFAPPTPVLISLSLSSSSSSSSSSGTGGSIRIFGNIIQTKSNHHLAHLAELMHQPIRDPSDYFALAQITRMGRRLENEFVNLLAVVKSIGKERHMKSRKDGRDIVCADLRILDTSCTDFLVTLWEPELISFVKTHCRTNEVVFFTDVLVKFDDKFRRGFYGCSSARTIMIPNPATADADRLRRLVQDDVARVFGSGSGGGGQLSNDAGTGNELDVSQITDQFTVDAIKQAYAACSVKMSELAKQRAASLSIGDHMMAAASSALTVTGYVYGALTRLPIVEPLSDFVKLACGNCGRFLEDGGGAAAAAAAAAAVIENNNNETGDCDTASKDYDDGRVDNYRQCPDLRCRVTFRCSSSPPPPPQQQHDNNINNKNADNNDNNDNSVAPSPVWRYRVSVDVSDDTGTLRWLHISDAIAQRLFNGMSAAELVRLSAKDRCNLKWRMLFEKYKIYFKIEPSHVSGRLSIIVLDVVAADVLEMAGLALGVTSTAAAAATAAAVTV